MRYLTLSFLLNSFEELEKESNQQMRGFAGRRAAGENRDEKLKRLTQQNARLKGKRDHLRLIKATVDELNEELVRKFKVAHQNYKFTKDIYHKGGHLH